MPFQYRDTSDARFAGTIGDLILRRGDIAAQQARDIANANARAVEISGNASAQAAQAIGQTVAAIPQEIRRNAVVEQQGKLGALDLEAKQRATDATKFLSKVMVETPKVTEDGVSVWDTPTITRAMADGGYGPEAGAAAQHLDGINNAFRQARASQVALVKQGAESVAAAGNDPDLANHFLDQMEANKLMPAADLAHYRDFIKADPANTAKLTAYLMGPQKGVVVPEGGQLVNPVTNEAAFKGTPKPPTRVELGVIANDPTKTPEERAAAAKALATAYPQPTPARTAEQDKAEYLGIIAKKQLGQALTPEEQAKATAYEQEKTLGVDKSASAAADRQANAIGAQTAQQKRAQDFSEAQAGRKELTDKVEAPFRQAQQSAQELRDLVHAAQAGNKEAASLQALQATMSTVRANGLNRLNQAEMKLPEGAGSVWDRVAGKVGKLVSGQPIDASLQKDLLDLADLMEKGAYNRYTTSHKDITTRYKLTDEKPAAPPFVRMRAPNGQETDVMLGQVDHYKALGATVVK